jgi:hypothetical protein
MIRAAVDKAEYDAADGDRQNVLVLQAWARDAAAGWDGGPDEQHPVASVEIYRTAQIPARE